MAVFKDGQNFSTIWMKQKTKKVYKGDKKGEEYEVLVGSIDIGGGKMLTMELYADLELRTVGKDDEEMLPLKVRKWKGEPKRASGSKKKTW